MQKKQHVNFIKHVSKGAQDTPSRRRDSGRLFILVFNWKGGKEYD